MRLVDHDADRRSLREVEGLVLKCVERTAFVVVPNPFLKCPSVVVCRWDWDRRGQWWRHRTPRATACVPG